MKLTINIQKQNSKINQREKKYSSRSDSKSARSLLNNNNRSQETEKKSFKTEVSTHKDVFKPTQSLPLLKEIQKAVLPAEEN